MAYTNNSMLIEASELFEKLESKNTIIIDCDVSDVFQRAHIKNAKTLPTHHYIKQEGFKNDPKNEVNYDINCMYWTDLTLSNMIRI